MGLHKHTFGESPVASASLNGNSNFTLSRILELILDGATITNQTNLDSDFFVADTASLIYNMVYDAGTDRYETIDWSSATIYFVDITADSISAIADFEINNCSMVQISATVWRLYNDTGTLEENKAEILKTLFYGTDGTNARAEATYMTNPTVFGVSLAGDVGKRAHYSKATATIDQAAGFTSALYTGTFVDTSTNTDSDFWSYVNLANANATPRVRSEYPQATNIIERTTNGTSDQIGTDTSADTLSNPADCEASSTSGSVGAECTGDVRLLILCKGDMTWAYTGNVSVHSEANINFFTDNSIPLFTAALSATDLTSTLISAGETITTDDLVAIMRSIKTIDATSSIVISVSFDNGSNWEVYTEEELIKIIVAGTNLLWKWVITRTDNTKIDHVDKYGAYYGENEV